MLNLFCRAAGPGRWWMELSGELDCVTIGQLGSAFGRLMESPELEVLVLDLTELTFLDSAGLGALLRVLKEVKGRGGTVVLVGVRAEVDRVFRITGTDRFFEVSRDGQEIGLGLTEIPAGVEADGGPAPEEIGTLQGNLHPTRRTLWRRPEPPVPRGPTRGGAAP